MGKIFLSIFLVFLAVLYFQYYRVFQSDKDVVYHHYQNCKKVQIGLQVQDMTLHENRLLAVADNWIQLRKSGALSQPNGKLYSISITKDNIITEQIPISLQSFHPLGLYLYQSSLYILSHNFQNGPVIQIFNITNSTAQHTQTIILPSIIGAFSDLIVQSPNQFYLSQFSSTPFPLNSSPFQSFSDFWLDFLQYKSTYVYRCIILNSFTDCTPLNNTQSSSVTGISKNKFGDYYILQSSLDQNKLISYKRNSDGSFRQKYSLGIRDRGWHIEYSAPQQRVYGGFMPWWHLIYTSGPIPSGIYQVRNWEHLPQLAYRRVFTQQNLVRGATCAARLDGSVFLGSSYDDSILVCPVVAPKTQDKQE